jgi:hypothetical protein
MILAKDDNYVKLVNFRLQNFLIWALFFSDFVLKF